MTIPWTERDASRDSVTGKRHLRIRWQGYINFISSYCLPRFTIIGWLTWVKMHDEHGRMCGKTSESVGHILAGCSAIAQTQYLARHNKALKILFFWDAMIFRPHPYNSALGHPSSTKAIVRERSSSCILGRPIVFGYHPRQGQQDWHEDHWQGEKGMSSMGILKTWPTLSSS